MAWRQGQAYSDRTSGRLWQRIRRTGRPLHPNECANYFRAAGYTDFDVKVL